MEDALIDFLWNLNTQMVILTKVKIEVWIGSTGFWTSSTDW